MKLTIKYKGFEVSYEGEDKQFYLNEVDKLVVRMINNIEEYIKENTHETN